jgi:precorrin-6Y C5,15-methyltransferase (decarboxylating)
MLSNPSLRAIAVEMRAERAARIGRNAVKLGVPLLEVVEGRAPEALSALPRPDAIFVGGGTADPALLDVALHTTRPSGRIVANAVTIEAEAQLIARHAALGGDLVRLAISRVDRIGAKHAWRAALPITQWRWGRP